MGKALGLLPSWYWPPGVQRYLKAPRVPLYDLAVGRWARRYGNDSALLADGGAQSFRQLDEACARVAANYLSWAESGSRVALAVQSADQFAPLFLGLVRADATILLLKDASSMPARRALDEFQPDILIADAAPPATAAHCQPAAAFLEAEAPAPRRIAPDPARPSIALPGRDGLVWHSQMSLLSGAMAFAAFIKLEPPARLHVARPPASWEGLIGLLAPLQAGAASVRDNGADRRLTASLLREHGAGVLWLDGAAAGQLLDAGEPFAAAIRETKPNVFLTTTTAFPKRVRRALRRSWRTAVLTVYGYPETGAIAAAHPSWYLDEAVGIPMTGVDIIALNPRTGRPIEPPWELLSYAGIGVRTYARATNLQSCEEEGAEGVDNRCYNTGTVGVIDANGMLFLLG